MAVVAAAGSGAGGLAPATFLLNRIFSPQFAVVVLVAWALALRSSLATEPSSSRGVAAGVATAANAFVYPFAPPFYETTWQLASATLFAVGPALTAWLALKPAPMTRTHVALVHSILHFGSTETYIRELVRRADPATVRWTLVIPDDDVLQPLREPTLTSSRCRSRATRTRCVRRVWSGGASARRARSRARRRRRPACAARRAHP